MKTKENIGQYCPALYKSVFITANARDGRINPCCVYEDWQPGHEDLKEKSKQIATPLHNSILLKDDRMTVAEGKIPKGCRWCVKEEAKSKGHYSYRRDMIAKWGEVPEEWINTDGSVSDLAVEKLDIRLGNVCNLMCQFCGGHNSHLIAKEAGEKQILRRVVDNPDIFDSIIDGIKRYENLKEINFAGGEPLFMKKELLIILDKLKHKRKKEMAVKFISNATIYDREILEKLEPFKKIVFDFSVDATGRSLEIARWGSSWKDTQMVMTQYLRWQDTINQRGKKINCSLVPTLSVFTILDCPQLFEWMTEMQLETECVTFMEQPSEQQINMLPIDVLQELKQKLLDNTRINRSLINFDDVIVGIDEAIKNNDVSRETIDKFWKWNSYAEEKRNYKLQEELPELYSKLKK